MMIWRNIYAITSVLEARGMRVIYAENGKVGVRLLQDNPTVDLVLMDVMMPEMDGLAATREIRKDERFAKLPIISLTAKAMKGDREKALEAGATDYVTKPVDPDRLLAVMYHWLGGHALEKVVAKEPDVGPPKPRSIFLLVDDRPRTSCLSGRSSIPRPTIWSR